MLAGRTHRQGEESEPFGGCAKETPDMCPCTAQQNGFLDGESLVGYRGAKGGWELCLQMFGSKFYDSTQKKLAIDFFSCETLEARNNYIFNDTVFFYTLEITYVLLISRYFRWCLIQSSDLVGIQPLALYHGLPKLEAKEQSDVWKKTEAEFNVQKMIWQSLSPGSQWEPEKGNFIFISGEGKKCRMVEAC